MWIINAHNKLFVHEPIREYKSTPRQHTAGLSFYMTLCLQLTAYWLTRYKMTITTTTTTKMIIWQIITCSFDEFKNTTSEKTQFNCWLHYKEYCSRWKLIILHKVLLSTKTNQIPTADGLYMMQYNSKWKPNNQQKLLSKSQCLCLSILD